MKKTTICFVIILFLISMIPILEATDYEDSFAGINIKINSDYEIEGHIDMLVPVEDFQDKINTDVNSSFIETFPNYETFSYLNNTEWISYWAYVDGASCYKEESGFDAYIFANSKEELQSLDKVKFIYVDNNGDIVSESQIVDVPNAWFAITYSRLHSFDVDSLEFDIDMSIKLDEVFVFIVIITSFISILFTAYRLLVNRLFKLKYRNKSNNGIYYFVVHLLIIIIGFIILNRIEFVQLLVGNVFSLIIFLALLFSIEITISYCVRYKYLKLGRYLFSSLVAYGSLLILLFFR